MTVTGPGRAARPVVVFVGGPPASGKTTLARALGDARGAVVLDLDVATGPLTALVLELIGARDLSDARAAELTRDRRYETLLNLAVAVTRAGVSAVLVAPFTLESTAAGWTAATRRLSGSATRLVWLTVPQAELARRLLARGAARDLVKRQDTDAWLASLPPGPPSAPHLVVDGTQPLARMVALVLDDLAAVTG